MKKIIFISIFLIFLLTGGILFGIHNFSSSKVKDRDFMVIKGYGKNMYPLRDTIKKGTKAIDVVKFMENVIVEPKKIYIKEHNKWIEVYKNDKLFKDTTIKIQL